MCDDYDQRIHTVVSRVLRVPANILHNDLRRGTLDEWDSLGHVVLVGALCEEFKVDISAGRALEMQTIGDIKRIIRELTD